MCKIYPIGTKLYVLSEKAVKNSNMNWEKIRVCRVKTYQNINNKIVPVLQEIGTSAIITANCVIFDKIEAAVKCLKGETKKKKS